MVEYKVFNGMFKFEQSYVKMYDIKNIFRQVRYYNGDAKGYQDAHIYLVFEYFGGGVHEILLIKTQGCHYELISPEAKQLFEKAKDFATQCEKHYENWLGHIDNEI